MILGIETVTKVGSLAVVKNGEILAQSTIDAELNHAASLISVLNNLLESINVDISEIDAIAVDAGPGSFTGIRVGIASAEGLVQPDGKRLVGVCSLEVLCYELAKKELLKGELKCLVPFIDAKRGGVYTGWYQIENNELGVVKGPHLTTLKELLDDRPSNSFIFGPDMKMINKEKDNVFPSAGLVGLLAEKKMNKRSEEKPIEPMYIYDVEYRRS